MDEGLAEGGELVLVDAWGGADDDGVVGCELEKGLDEGAVEEEEVDDGVDVGDFFELVHPVDFLSDAFELVRDDLVVGDDEVLDELVDLDVPSFFFEFSEFVQEVLFASHLQDA